MKNRASTLVDDLKASVLAESIVSRVLAAKKRFPKEVYRKLTQRIAELEQSEQANEYFSDPSNEDFDFGIDSRTGHVHGCDCGHCLPILEFDEAKHGRKRFPSELAQHA